jgi:hypothetical protein
MGRRGIRRDFPEPSWAVLHEAMENQGRPKAWRETGHWALDVLATELGHDWPTRAVNAFGTLPLPLLMASAHTVAYAEVLELALRVRLLKEATGFADARNETRGDRRLERAFHFTLQMEVAGLATRLGWEVSLEVGRPAPMDVVIRTPEAELGVETKFLGPTSHTMEDDSTLERAFDRLQSEAARRGVRVHGHMSNVPTTRTIDRAVEWIAHSAAFVERGGLVLAFREGEMRLELVAGDDPGRQRLVGPASNEDLLPRLLNAIRKKAAQMQKTGAGWLRLDAFNGLWSMTRWGTSPMSVKVPAIESALAGVFAGEGLMIDGLVLCSAAALFTGRVQEEKVQTPGGAVGMRYPVSPMRAREAIVVPIRNQGAGAAEWIAMQETERDWLSWALDKFDLPSESELFASVGSERLARGREA